MSNTEKDIEQDIREMESEVENIELETEESIEDQNIEETEVVTEEVNEYEQKYMRLLADFDNLKRNNAKDVMNAKNN